MKIKCEIEMDLESGEYDIVFRNVSNPGESIEYNEVQEFLKQVFSNVDEEIMGAGPEDDQVLKIVH